MKLLFLLMLGYLLDFGLLLAQSDPNVPTNDASRIDRQLKMSMLNCGPRSVSFVLRHFGMNKDLISVIDAMRADQTERGHSIESLCHYLQQQGLQAVPIKLRPGHFVLSENPMIALVKPVGQELDHFIVILPESSKTQLVYWDGLLGTRSVPIERFYKRFQGYLIFVTEDEIDFDSNDGISSKVFAANAYFGSQSLLRPIGVAVCCLGIFSLLVCFFLKRRVE